MWYYSRRAMKWHEGCFIDIRHSINLRLKLQIYAKRFRVWGAPW